MRNLKEHPVTIVEIEEALLKEADRIQLEDTIGDMRPLLFRSAANVVRRAGFLTHDLSGRYRT